MRIVGVFKSNLRVTSKETALEFLDGIKSVLIISDVRRPNFVYRFEPGRLVGHFDRDDMDHAEFIPNFQDPYGNIAYRARRSINAYLEDH